MLAANIVDLPNPPADPRYRLGSRLGGGAEGETWTAVDGATGETCAVKVFAAGARAQAVSEFGRLRSLEHPSIVRVRDIGRLDDGRLYVVTDLVAGPGVDHISGMPNEESRRSAFEQAALDLASAVGHLHARGVVHGDICPANVRLTEGAAGRWHPVLIDFGLAGPPLSGTGGARGTLGYAAPEALTGARTASADLFSLGATLFEAWSGTAPFGRGLPSVARTLEGPAPSLSSIRPGLGEGWDALLGRLLAADPTGRPASARALLRDVHRLVSGSATPTEIDLGIPYPEGDPLAGIFVGRRAERAALRLALDRLADGEVDAGVLVLVGGPGAGRRTLFDLVARDVAVAAAAGAGPAVEVWRGDMAALERLSGATSSSDADPARLAEARMAGVAAWMEARAALRPLCVLLDEGPAARSFATFVSGAAPTGRSLVVLPGVEGIERPFAAAIELGRFGDPDILELVAAGVEVTPPREAIGLIVRTAGASAAIAVALVRRLVTNLRAGQGDRLHLDAGTDLGALLKESFRALPADAQRVSLAVALGGQTAAGAVLADLERAGASLRAARAAGWIAQDDDGNLRAPSAAHRLAALGAAPQQLTTDVATIVLGLLEKDDPRRADVLIALGRPMEAADALRLVAAQQVATDRQLGAVELLGRARALAPEALTFDERMVLASGLGALGRYDEAAAVLTEARARTDGPAAELSRSEREAWLLTRRGDLEAARALLERAIADHPEPAAITAPLRTRLGRLLVTAGRFREALEVVEPFLAPALGGDNGTASHPLALEAALLASAYLGDAPTASRRLAELGRCASVPSGKLAYLEGLLAQLAGDERAAGEAYRRAFEIAARDNDVHTVAAVAVNLGGVLTEEGLYGEALTASERAVRELGRLGAAAELGPALVNAANLFVQLGDLPAARRALERARGLASHHGRPTRVGATAAFVEGDSWRRAGDLDAAVSAYRRAAALFVEVGQPGAVAAMAAACEALAARARLDEARRAFAEAQALAGPRGPEGDDDPDLLRAEGLLALAGIALGDPSSLAARLNELGRSLAARRRRPRAWRLAALAARLFARIGQPEAARSALELARKLFEEVRMATPEHHRAALDRDPEAAWLAAEGGAPTGDGELGARALAAESRLRRLLRINKRVNSELRLPRLLEMIVDTVIELTDAERGFLLLEDDGGVLNVKVARNIDERTLDTAEFELSRSIATQAAAGGEAVVTIDAAGDSRFREALSVSDLHLRSVLAVPLSIKGKVVGTIYVDHRLRKGAFDQEDVRLVQDFAEQAAIAIENARLLGELRRRERQVDALNRRLESELVARREELSGIKVELRENREALAVRYDYRNIVGRTPRMLELFRLIDRITDTSLPVVVQGESGTGKELVARALHSNGPRRNRPFVGENCAAIPETLLESTLFGYVRGAFTGAEHDTRGLFEIADGGTLFLDEVGEMSPAMQGKLLRVLQEGELRRVGSERTRKVDVRVVAATNRDLARLVEEGKFRSDLFFRLNVASITLPALRERRDDIPLLVEHFLAKLAKAAGRPAPRPIDPAALARLCAYRWPGNVRELENELMRAEALSTGRISAADLSPRLTAADEAGALIAESPDSLTLKPRVERLERSLLREALVRSGNNQTKAAELLGLSRFGLQKKLKRYNFG